MAVCGAKAQARRPSEEDRRALHWVDKPDGGYRVLLTLPPQVDGDYRVVPALSPQVRSSDDALQDGASDQLPLRPDPLADIAQLSPFPRHGHPGQKSRLTRRRQDYPLDHGFDSVHREAPDIQPYHQAH